MNNRPWERDDWFDSGYEADFVGYAKEPLEGDELEAMMRQVGLDEKPKQNKYRKGRRK